MKKSDLRMAAFAAFIIITGLLYGCESTCICEYVVYDNDPTTSGWEESYRSTWDASCQDEVLSEDTYTDSDGDQWRSKTVVECK